MITSLLKKLSGPGSLLIIIPGGGSPGGGGPRKKWGLGAAWSPGASGKYGSTELKTI